MKRHSARGTERGERKEKSGFPNCLKETQLLLMLLTAGFTSTESKYHEFLTLQTVSLKRKKKEKKLKTVVLRRYEAD